MRFCTAASGHFDAEPDAEAGAGIEDGGAPAAGGGCEVEGVAPREWPAPGKGVDWEVEAGVADEAAELAGG